MNTLLCAPTNFNIIGENKSATATWDSVPGADGYRIDYYLVSNPSKRSKYRYSQTNKKKILGFQNGTEYFACVSAFQYINGKESFGPKSEYAYFTPISRSLSSYAVVCLHIGEEKQIDWEYMNSKPEVYFSIEDDSIASISAEGFVTGKKAGNTKILLSLKSTNQFVSEEDSHFIVDVYVERSLSNNHLTNSASSALDIVIAGDLMCSVGTQTAAQNRSFDFTDIFSNRILDFLKNNDFVIGNLETMCDDSRPFEKEIYRLPRGSANNNSPSSFLYGLKNAGFNGLVTANNHNADCGIDGLNTTISAIKNNNMFHIGSLDDNPIYISKGNFKIAIIALSMVNNKIDDISEDPKNELARYSDEHFLYLSNKAKENKCDYTIVIMHWGIMNSTIISNYQKKTASFLANNGADIIIGSEPHVLQGFEYIKTPSKEVPCYYSLGNFYSSMREMYENTVGGLVHIHFDNLSLLDSKVSVHPTISFIPTLCLKHNRYSAIVDLVSPVITKEHQRAQDYINNLFVKKVSSPQMPNHKIAMQGSSILRDIRSYSSLPTFDEGLIISPLTIFDEKIDSTDCYNSKNDNLSIDISKSYYEKLKSSQSNFYCFDLYAVAAISIYEYVENGTLTHFTATSKFLNSDFYKQNIDKMTKIIPSQNIEYTKTLLDKYIDTIRTLFSNDKTILVRVAPPQMGFKQGELRNIKISKKLYTFLHIIEDYVIAKINPCVIDVSQYFFKNVEIGNIFTYEKYFYIQAMDYISDYINNPSGKYYFNDLNPAIWIRRIITFYKNMAARSYQKYLLNNTDAADIIIANSSLEFISKYQNALIELKKNKVSIDYVENILPASDSEVIEAAKAIIFMRKNDFSQQYSEYEIAFKYNFHVLKTFSKNLSTSIGHYITAENINDIYKIKNDKCALDAYFERNPVTHIDIWGSCISREIVNKSQPRICVDNYIFKQSQILSSDPPISSIVCSDNVSDYENNAWRMKTIKGSINRDGRSILKNNHSKILLIDFYDLICTMKKYKNELFEVDDFIERTNFYKSIKDECSTTYLYNELDIEDSSIRMKEFSNFLLEIYGNKIILIIADLKNNYIDLHGNMLPLSDDGSYSEKVKYIKALEKVFIETTNCYVIDDSCKYMASDTFPLGGAHIVHYEPEFYKNAAQKLLSIIEEL